MAAPQALYLSPAQASSGTTLTIALPSGPVTARIPPVRSGKILKVKTAHGEEYLRVRVTLSMGRRLSRVVSGFILFIMIAMGPVFLISSAFAPPPNPYAPPMCGGQVMGTSDSCEIDDQGASTTYTYTQMQQMQTETGNSGLVAVGAILTGCDVTAAVVVLLMRRSLRKHPIPVRAAPAALDRS